MARASFPLTAIVGQDALIKALLANVVNPGIGGVLIRGEKGTAKSTAVRALPDVLPEMEAVEGCPNNCDPAARDDELFPACLGRGRPLPAVRRKVRITEVPIGATEDRLVGTLDIEGVLADGRRRFQPGLLSDAHRGILYVDEVNLLPDHLVDVLLDAAAMGRNHVEREGVSWSHPSRFALVGTMNPEEGDLRPQFLDRFGLCVAVRGLERPEDRLAVLKRRLAFDEDPELFLEAGRAEAEALADRLSEARRLAPEVEAGDEAMMWIVGRSLAAGVDGHRADVVTLKTAKARAALDGRRAVSQDDLEEASGMALPHRLRRRPFEDPAPRAGARPDARGPASAGQTPKRG